MRKIQSTLAALYRRQHRHDDAERASAAARANTETLAASLPDGLIRAAFVANALAELPTSRPITTGQAARQRYGGLTAREREVVRLIASGLTNRAIAERLILGEHTIETHVSHILGKLACTSRAQIAAWAVAQGLAERQGS